MYVIPKYKEAVMFLSLKGGCGKSTISCSYAYWLAEKYHKKVAILDMDVTSPSVAKILGLQGKDVEVKTGLLIPVRYSENLKVMSVDFFLRKYDQPILFKEKTKLSVIEQVLYSTDFGKVDYFVLDCPPSTSGELIKILELFDKKKLKIVFVTQPSPISTNGVIKSIRYLKERGYRISGIVSNMDGFICSHCGKISELFIDSKNQTESIAKRYKIPLLGKVPMGIMKVGKNGEYIIDHPIFDEIALKITKLKPVKFKEKDIRKSILTKLILASKMKKAFKEAGV